MNPTLEQNLVWLVETLGYLAVAVQLVRCAQLKRWPSLFVYCTLYTAGSALLFFLLPHYGWYFYCFWARELVLGGLRIWVLADLIRSIPAGRFIPRSIYVVGFTLGATVFFFAASLTAYGSHPVDPVGWVLLVNKCATVAWTGALVVVLVSIAASGFGFDRQPVKIGSGYLVMVCSGMIAATLYASGLSYGAKVRVNVLAGLLSIATLGYWFRVLALPFGFAVLTTEQDYELTRTLEYLESDLFPNAEDDETT